MRVSYSATLDNTRRILSPITMSILEKAAEQSNNKEVVITSTIRTPFSQASAMHKNIQITSLAEQRKLYGTVGNEVLDVYEVNKKSPSVIVLMEKKIIELSKIGKRVSLHCVSEEEYRKNNIVDISIAKLKNPIDFTNELLKNLLVSRIITPLNFKYNSDKVKINPAEPALHIEINV